MNNTERISKIKSRLATLNPTHISVTDESHLHIGHAGAQSGAGHFALEISSEQLNGKTRIKQHQMIYALLDDLIPNEVHALRIAVL